MPNPVVSFEIRGPDPGLLHAFYREVFGWEIFPYSEAYAGVETAAHMHDEASGTVTYTGDDAHLNDVELGTNGGRPAWRFKGQAPWRGYEPGVTGGIARGNAGLGFYIQVAELDAALERVEAHGGVVLQPPTEVAPNVFIATFGDPAGNEVGLIRA